MFCKINRHGVCRFHFGVGAGVGAEGVETGPSAEQMVSATGEHSAIVEVVHVVQAKHGWGQHAHTHSQVDKRCNMSSTSLFDAT